MELGRKRCVGPAVHMSLAPAGGTKSNHLIYSMTGTQRLAASREKGSASCRLPDPPEPCGTGGWSGGHTLLKGGAPEPDSLCWDLRSAACQLRDAVTWYTHRQKWI